MLLTSCLSTKQTVIYKAYVPAIAFPSEFPEAEWITEDKAKGTCTVPSDWIVQLSIYKIRIESKIETYNLIKEAVEENQNETSTDSR